MGIAHSLTETDALYQLDFGDGKKALLPKVSTMIVDDTSGLFSIKAIGTRKTLFLVKDVSNNTIDDGGNGSGGGTGGSD